MAAVWEWKSEENIWLPYSGEVSIFLDKIERKKLSFAQLGDIDPNLAKYTINLTKFVEETGGSDVTRPVRRFVYNDTIITKGVCWQWADRNSETWHFYQIEVQQHIENSFQKAKQVELNLEEKFSHLAYLINFTALTQTSKQTGCTRSIRRIEENVYPRVKTRLTRASTLLPAGNSQLEASVKSGRKSRPRRSRSTSADSMSTMNCAGTSGKHQLQESPSGDNEKPVPGVKLPSEICLVNAIDVKSVDEMFSQYTVPASPMSNDDDCSICCCSLTTPSYFEDGSDAVIELKSCSHKFHQSCISAMYNSSNKVGYLQCPTCKIIYGVKVGNQPPGQMHYAVVPSSVPGYTDCETIVITYYIPHGVQGPEHPQCGATYTARGFPRRCFLPDNDEGRKVMKLLVTAWERRLIFTIGQSSTTGEECTVTWNEIHHKTEFGSNYSGHGYPDPLYLENVLQELALQGVTEELVE
uniref:E3 ubiquitin-protein ligase n=1 Tax=Strigamia maritima TaxID=126957 RepID=T1J6J2_STRMM